MKELNQIQSGRFDAFSSEKTKKRYDFHQSEQAHDKSQGELMTLQANQIFVSVNNNYMTPKNFQLTKDSQ